METPASNKPFGIAVVGLGTVGCGLLKILEENKKLIELRNGNKIKVIAVSAKNEQKERGVDISDYSWVAEPLEIINSKEIDCVVELVGGHDGLAKELVLKAIKNGKSVVTANKALLAHHGQEIASLADRNKVNVYFEAAVAGGIPIISTLLKSLSPNKTKKIVGIINGTCNYILTEMERNSSSYETAFSKAQGLGYVELNPELDIGGIDAAHKLVLLSKIVFHQKISLSDVKITGIKDISLFDINSAKELGYRIKLLATAKMTQKGIDNEVAPCLIPLSSPVAQVVGSENIICVENNYLGDTYYRGSGAGEGPTASAVMADIMNISKDSYRPMFGIPENKMSISKSLSLDTENSFYVRVTIKDEPGALSHITGIFAKNKISINRMRQKDHQGKEAPIVLLTHRISSFKIMQCIKELSRDEMCIENPVCLRVEDI